MGEGRGHYPLFFSSKENPDTQVRSHCSVVEIIDSRINIGISRITCCVSQNFWNSENDEAECIINCEAFSTKEEVVAKTTGRKINSDVVSTGKKDGFVS